MERFYGRIETTNLREGMGNYTRYLATFATAINEYEVQVSSSSPTILSQNAIRNSQDVKYSPILPAYLIPRQEPSKIPKTLDSVALLFANAPYTSLGTLKPSLTDTEPEGIYFTVGLASIVLLNFTYERAIQLSQIASDCLVEYWPLKAGKLHLQSIRLKLPEAKQRTPIQELLLPLSDDPELRVYIEQISASLASLSASYGVYFPDELDTLRQIAIQTVSLIRIHTELQSSLGDATEALALQKKLNAIRAALVEISAALSYAVTQGTTGALPVLSNRSPFPHHSLLGIGGAVRALTKYTRYLENAFMVRSAGKVISGPYSTIEHQMPASIPKYASGHQYEFPDASTTVLEHFDGRGDFPQDDQLPLIAHFSLRHGFMESKFSITGASEALTAEALPHWTLMTLSHEIMHSRVRTIFQALFGKTWDGHERKVITKEHFDEFASWVLARQSPKPMKVRLSLRNLILNFCYGTAVSLKPVARADVRSGNLLSMETLNESYARHKQLAIEIIVHFHDYYFVYACQPKMYLMSLWASWIRVAAPFARPLEYLTRSLVTVACGSGLPPEAAFDRAKDLILDALDALEAGGTKSSLFADLRQFLSTKQNETRARFCPAYYLIDNIRLFFASRTIAAELDRIEQDPFANGSVSAEDYTSNIYVYGEGDLISPIRYSLASLFRTLSNQQPIDDPQWLSAWNYMVISSQEIYS
jgi:hypothetical protein